MAASVSRTVSRLFSGMCRFGSNGPSNGIAPLHFCVRVAGMARSVHTETGFGYQSAAASNAPTANGRRVIVPPAACPLVLSGCADYAAVQSAGWQPGRVPTRSSAASAMMEK